MPVKIPEIMRQSVISLNFSNSRQGRQIKARTFEVPGAGGFLMTETAPGFGTVVSNRRGDRRVSHPSGA